MYCITSDDAFGLVVIATARIQVPIETWKIAARDLDPDAMTGFKIIAGGHRLQGDFVDFARFHPDVWLVVAVAITHALNRFVEIVRAPVRINVDQLDGEVSVFCIGRDVKRDFDRTTHFDSFAQRLGAIDEHIRSCFALALVESEARPDVLVYSTEALREGDR